MKNAKKKKIIVGIVILIALVLIFGRDIFGSKKHPGANEGPEISAIKLNEDMLWGIWQDINGGQLRFEFGDVSTESPGYNDIYEGIFHATGIGEEKKDFEGWFNLDEEKDIIFLESEDESFPLELVFATKAGEDTILTTGNGEFSFRRIER